MSDPNQDASDARSTNSTMSCWYNGIKTPTSSDFERHTQAEYVSSVPCPGKTYRIHLKDTDKVVTLSEGEVLLQSPAAPELGCGWYWACVENRNWLGFRNHVSGNFLGHNEREDLSAVIYAKRANQSMFESFCVRHHPHGGYVLLVWSTQARYLQQIGCASDGKRLVTKEKDGVQWMFEEVHMGVQS